MSIGKKLLLGFIALLSLSIGSLYLIPLETYLPQLEKFASKQFQTPVKIQSISLAALPFPHLELHQVQLGKADGIRAELIDVSFDLKALMAGNKEVRAIRAEHVVVNYSEFRHLLAQMSKSSGKPIVTLREFQASDVTLILPWLTLPDVETKVSFAADGKLEKIWTTLDKQHLTATLLPQPQRHFAMQVDAKGWTTPLYPRLVWDELHVAGVVSDQDLVATQLTGVMGDIHLSGSGRAEFAKRLLVFAQLDQLDAPVDQLLKLSDKTELATGSVHLSGKLQGEGDTVTELKQRVQFVGEVSGKQLQIPVVVDQPGVLLDELHAQIQAQVDQIDLSVLDVSLYGGRLTGLAKWSRLDQALQAEIQLENIEMQPLVAAMTNRVVLNGKLAGKGNVVMQLSAQVPFPANSSAEGDFHLKDGKLTQVDLVKAAQLSKSKQAVDSSEGTEFDDFTGEFKVDGGAYYFQKLDLSSGVLRAQGKMNVLSDKRITGGLDAYLKGTLGLVSIPLVISGTTDQPHVNPSGAFLAGAALGTALMPGVGTVIGMKIGGLLNKIFSDDGPVAAKSAVPRR
ncbi:MAG: AsmA family protein [Gallionella sp.]|nr:AsmA family protein [Gallionella sp.]